MSYSKLKLFAIITGIFAVMSLWAFGPLRELADVARAAQLLERASGSTLAPLIVIGMFVIGGLVLFPVTVMSAATIILWGGPSGGLYALSGILASGSVGYFIGSRLAGPRLRAFLARRTAAIGARSSHGIVSVALIRHVPVAPFSIVNMAIGASQISFSSFFLGTFLGMLPSVLMVTLLKDRLVAAAAQPDLESALLFAAFLAFFFVAYGLLRHVSGRMVSPEGNG